MKLLVAILAATALLAGCGAPASMLQPQADGTYLVNLTSGNQFSPARGQLPVGANVTFMSHGFHDVQITGPNGIIASSGPPMALEPGDSWSYTFAVPGSYHLVCHAHANATGMTADFVVVEASTASSSAAA